jgi:hypothetical protein
MTAWFTGAVLVISALVHLAPAIGVLGAGALERLYGLTPANDATLLLLRHRAVLFGVIGVLLAWCAARPDRHASGLAIAATCVGAFLVLARGDAVATAALQRVWRVDAGVFVLVVVAGVLRVVR